MDDTEKKTSNQVLFPLFVPDDIKASQINHLSDSIIRYYDPSAIQAFIKKAEKSEKSEQDKNQVKEKPVDVVIIVAVPSEHDGVYHAFNISKSINRSTDLLDKFRFSHLRFEQDGLQIALLIQPGMGMTHSSSLCTRAILAFNPKLIAMVGICAGRLNKVNLGDIIIASSVLDYTAGKKYIDHFGPRPQAQQIDTAISEFVSTTVLGNHELLGRIIDNYNGEKPHSVSIHLKPMASGTAVIDDPKIVEEIASIQDDLAAIDMESYALATAANILRTKWIVIKTVQDFADGNKSQAEASSRAFATYSSAKLLQQILTNLRPYLD